MLKGHSMLKRMTLLDIENVFDVEKVTNSFFEAYKEKYLELKEKKQCEKCHAEIDLDSTFCSKCAAKQSEVEVKEAEVKEYTAKALEALKVLEDESGAGNDFLGWKHLPTQTPESLITD